MSAPNVDGEEPGIDDPRRVPGVRGGLVDEEGGSRSTEKESHKACAHGRDTRIPQRIPHVVAYLSRQFGTRQAYQMNLLADAQGSVPGRSTPRAALRGYGPAVR